jgi:hypothetical protein
MAHDHHHHHEGEQNAYYLEQIFTIAICGAIGGVAIMLWYGNKLWWLADRFHPWLLGGGFALLALVVIRAIAVWRSVDTQDAVDALDADPHDHSHHEHAPGEACDHDHSHGHVHSHEPASGQITEQVPVHSHGYSLGHDHAHGHDHGHDHDHGHHHGWAPWRYVILLLPVLLYFLNLPNKGFSTQHGGGVDLSGLSAPDKIVQSTGVAEIGFSQLEQMALTAEGRGAYEGKTITLVGQYYGGDPKMFTLRRYKMVCCAPDARPLNAVIILDRKSADRLDPDVYHNQWVQVTGRIHFEDRGGRYLTEIILYPSKDEPLQELVKVVPPDPNPFVN